MRLPFTLFLPLAVLVAACTTDDMPGPTEGQAVYARNCSACHGADGTGGKGPDLTKISARNGGTFPAASVLSKIDGYGRGSVSVDVMPEFGALLEGDLVPVDIDGTLTPTPRNLAGLLFYLESIQVP
ncbi:MAG: c-type cytochrome [Paracoccaceae bacterium]